MDLLEHSIRCLHDKVVSITNLHHFSREVFGFGTNLRGNGSSVALPDTQLLLFSFPFWRGGRKGRGRKEGGEGEVAGGGGDRREREISSGVRKRSSKGLCD